jgi:hypothetical protein
VRTKHLSREQLGNLAAWANREFYSSRGRVQRILEDEHINPFPLQIFKSYMKSMDDYANKASGDSDKTGKRPDSGSADVRPDSAYR